MAERTTFINKAIKAHKSECTSLRLIFPYIKSETVKFGHDHETSGNDQLPTEAIWGSVLPQEPVSNEPLDPRKYVDQSLGRSLKLSRREGNFK